MALMYSPEAKSKFHFPEFQLPATDGNSYSTSQLLTGRPVVVMFLCNHCPYVQAIEDRLIDIARKYSESVQFVGVCSNSPEDYPEDSFENLKLRAEEKNYSFPYLHDEGQKVAKQFSAVCTPDIFLFDANGELSYRGRLDDSWKDPNRVTKKELEMAIDAVLQGEKISADAQNPSMGCSIKWKENGV